MKFDTEESFFRAVYGNNSNLSPFSIAEASLPGVSDSHARKIVCTHLVGLMRAAFLVHQRCLAQPIPERDFLGQAVNTAAEVLPPGHQIAITIQHGIIDVYAYGPNDAPIQVETVEGGVEAQVRSITAVMLAAGKVGS